MKVLVEICHPSHYYLFKNVIRKLREKGAEVLIAVKNRENIITALLEKDKEKYVLVGSTMAGLIRKALYLPIYELRLLEIAIDFNPDIFLSMNSVYSAHISFLMRKKHIAYTDTEVSRIITLLLLPFTHTVITPKSFRPIFRYKNHIQTDSYKVMAYLDPRFFIPDASILKELGISKQDKIAIIRFSSFDASHDIGITGLNNESKKRLINEIRKFARPIISSETPLAQEHKEFEYSLGPEKMLSLLALADIYVGEGATMACEAALLGTPSIFIHPNSAGILNELESKGLLMNFHNPNAEIEEIIMQVRRILLDNKYKEQQKENIVGIFHSKEDLNESIVSEVIKAYSSKL